MIRQITTRLLLAIPVVFGVITLTFFLLHFIPGDPVDIMLGPQAALEDKSRLRSELGLDLPIMTQYQKFLIQTIRGNWGRSLTTRNHVFEEISSRIFATFELAFSALFLAIVFGVSLSLIAVLYRHKPIDHLVSVFGILGLSTPSFWLGPLLILIFSLHLGWLPVSERTGIDSLILPSLTLALALMASIFRMSRASLLETINEDYIRTARAKGLSEFHVLFKHALKNSMMPVLTIIGLQLGSLLSGAVIAETIFDWPGIGTLFYNSIQQRDYPTVQGCVLFISLVYVFVNLLTDIAYVVVNPKVRLD